MKESFPISREYCLKSKSSNVRNDFSNLKTGETTNNNLNNYTFKQNNYMIEKYFNIKTDLRIKNDYFLKRLNNKSQGNLNTSYTNQLSNNSKVSKNNFNKKKSKPFEKILQKNNKTFEKIQTKTKIKYNDYSILTSEINKEKSNVKNSFDISNKKTHSRQTSETLFNPLNADLGPCVFLTTSKANQNEKIRKIENFEERINNNYNAYSKRIQEFKDLCFELKIDPNLQNKNILINNFKKILQEFENEKIENLENEYDKFNIEEKNNYLFYSSKNIEKKLTTLIKENENLKEIIRTKFIDIEQVKILLTNLNSFFKKINKNLISENFRSKDIPFKKQNKLKKERNFNLKKNRSTNISHSEKRMKEKENKSIKVCNMDDNSSISICSEFSVESSKDIINKRTYPKNSLKINRIKSEEEKLKEVLENNENLLFIYDKDSVSDSHDTNSKKYCFVNKLEITYKDFENESNSQLLNFINNSFKKEKMNLPLTIKDPMSLPLTIKDPKNNQSNFNSISTKTNTKIQHEVICRNESNDKFVKIIDNSLSDNQDNINQN